MPTSQPNFFACDDQTLIDHHRSTCNLRVLADGRLVCGRQVCADALDCNKMQSGFETETDVAAPQKCFVSERKVSKLDGYRNETKWILLLPSDPYPLPFPKEGHHVVFAILVFPCSSACDVLRILVGVIESPDPRRSHTNTNSRHFNIRNLHPCVWLASMLFWSRVAITEDLSGNGILLMGKEIK